MGATRAERGRGGSGEQFIVGGGSGRGQENLRFRRRRGVERERMGGFKFESRPLRACARAGRRGREGGDVGRMRERRGVGAGGAEEVGAVISATVADVGRAAGGRGRPRQVGPTCRRPGERGSEGGLRGGEGRSGPAQQGARGREMGRRPIKRKRKEKNRNSAKGFSWDLKLHFGDF